jgi:hypothetical protein
MRKSILNNTFVLATLCFAVACSPKKVIVKAPSATETTVVTKDSKEENLALLKSKDLPFNTLSLKGKATLDINGDENNVTMNIRIQKDKKIWLSVTGIAGIEGARAVITPDSLLIRNNLQKTFVQKPFSYIYNFTNKQVTFALLQSIFSGNTIADFTVPQANLVQENGVLILSGNNGDLAYRNTFNTLYKIAEATFNDPKASQSLKVTYGDYTAINNSLFPSSLNLISRAAGKRIGADIIFNKIEANVPVDFPFSVPKSYQLIK